jgi:hypothetical protein
VSHFLVDLAVSVVAIEQTTKNAKNIKQKSIF